MQFRWKQLLGEKCMYPTAKHKHLSFKKSQIITFLTHHLDFCYYLPSDRVIQQNVLSLPQEEEKSNCLVYSIPKILLKVHIHTLWKI